MKIKLSLIKEPCRLLISGKLVAVVLGIVVGISGDIYALGRMPPVTSNPTPFNAAPANRGPFDNGESVLYKSESDSSPQEFVKPSQSQKVNSQNQESVDVDPSINPTRGTGILAP